MKVFGFFDGFALWHGHCHTLAESDFGGLGRIYYDIPEIVTLNNPIS